MVTDSNSYHSKYSVTTGSKSLTTALPMTTSTLINKNLVLLSRCGCISTSSKWFLGRGSAELLGSLGNLTIVNKAANHGLMLRDAPPMSMVALVGLVCGAGGMNRYLHNAS